MECSKTIRGTSRDLGDTEEFFAYDLESFDEFTEEHDVSGFSRWFDRLIPMTYNYFHWDKDRSLDEKPFLDLFEKHRCPIFVLKNIERMSVTVELNPCLKDMQFYRYHDAHTAYQEISQYLGNELAVQKDPNVPVGNDVTLASSKGFDKWSFRKESNKKKKKG
jgi:hypothetical protein